MTDEKLGSLFGAIARYYWSIPVSFVRDKIKGWHPEVSDEQFERVLKECDEDIFWHHCCVETEGLKEPELVAEHLVALEDSPFYRFIDSRIDGPYRDCDEETILLVDKIRFDIPEVAAIIAFGKTELGLNDGWAQQLVDDCRFSQDDSLCDGSSWVKRVLQLEQLGKVHFRTIEQVERFRDLGNRFYQVRPNPVLKGWKPTEIENPPTLCDDIPEKISDGRASLEKLFDIYGGREKVTQILTQAVTGTSKIGRNDPCPCGSGKKYKKCCGARKQ